MRDPSAVFRAAVTALQAAETRNLPRLAAAADVLGPAAHIWCSGIGKSGIVARKIAGTLNSLGRRASFLHPVEALHGDGGGVAREDALIAVSQSGHTAELLRLVRELDLPTVAIGREPSPLAAVAKVCLDSAVDVEAGDEIPVTAFVVAASLGDALALSLGGELRHPGGFIGAMARPVREFMLPPPLVSPGTKVVDLIPALVHGAVLIETGGIFTDGDLRRAAGRGELDRPVGDICTRAPITVDQHEPARVALERMERRASQISVLPVVGEGRYVGIVRLHDLVRAGLGA